MNNTNVFDNTATDALYGGPGLDWLFAAPRPMPTGERSATPEITVSTWPKHARYGRRAGLGNERFLDPETLQRYFPSRLEPYGKRVGPLIFEFGTFYKSTFPTRGDFMARLDPFLKSLPQGLQYAVEIRNQEYLRPDYLEVLASHNVAHVFNAWTRMPSLDEQSRLEAFTADFTVVRALLQRGRPYEHAVQTFEPYRELKEPDEGARAGMQQIAEHALKTVIALPSALGVRAHGQRPRGRKFKSPV
jgi:hypothetical protein